MSYEWNESLLGGEITPGAWRRFGVVCEQATGKMMMMNNYWPVFSAAMGSNDFTPGADFLACFAPCYPPIGWQGIKERELWDAIVGLEEVYDFGSIHLGYHPMYVAYDWTIEGGYPVAHSLKEIAAHTSRVATEHQNAYMLAKRIVFGKREEEGNDTH